MWSFGYRFVAVFVCGRFECTPGFTFVCLYVLSVFPHDILKLVAARITKLDKEMFHGESWKPIYFWVKRSRSRVTKIADIGLCALVNAGFF